MKARNRFFSLVLSISLLVSGCAAGSSQKTASAEASSPPSKTAVPTETTVKSDFPTKPIEMIVPFGPGGSTDAVGRTFASVISKYLPNNQNVVILNEGGQATTRGTTLVAKAKPDGYTIGLVTSQSCDQGQYVVANVKYDYDDFTYIMRVHNMPGFCQVLPTSNIKTFQDFIDRMSGKGEPLLVGVLSATSAGGMALLELSKSYKLTNYKAIPYDTNGAVFSALQQGTVDAIWCSTDKSFDFVRLAAAGEERSKAWPDVPTVGELGYPIIPSDTYTVLVTPKGVPEDRLKIITDAFYQAYNDPEFVKVMEANDYELFYLNSEGVTKDIERTAQRIKQFYLENNMLVNDPKK